MADEETRGALIVERGRMRYLRGRWFVLWCAVALLLGLALGWGLGRR